MCGYGVCRNVLFYKQSFNLLGLQQAKIKALSIIVVFWCRSFAKIFHLLANIPRHTNELNNMMLQKQRKKREGPRLLIGATTVFAVHSLLGPHIKHLSKSYHITLVSCSSFHELNPDIASLVDFIDIPINRKPGFLRDVILLMKLFIIVKRTKPNITLTVTPKIGLFLTAISCICRIPKRVHIFTGQVWHTRTGLNRRFFMLLDRVLAQVTTHNLADSKSQISFLENQGIVKNGEINVLGNGSTTGIDPKVFSPNQTLRDNFRHQHNCTDDALVVLFLGRVVEDKGVFDAMKSLINAKKIIPSLRFWMVGPDEENNGSKLNNLAKKGGLNFTYFGKVPETIPYFQAADLLILPSKREGFGLVIIEAAACNTPTIAYETYGVVDAISNHETGVLVEYKNEKALERAVIDLLSDTEKLKAMGENARQRAHQKFAEKTSVAALAAIITQ